MLKKNLKIAFRRLWKDKRGTALHLLGLSIGLSSFLLLMQYAFFEKSYDRHHHRSEDIYRVTAEVYRNGELNTHSATTYLALSPSLQRDFPEIEKYVRFFAMSATIEMGDQRFREKKLYYADSTLFDLFAIPLLEGNPATALAAPNSMVISEDLAQRYFGTNDCIGEVVELSNWFPQRIFRITGVMENIPENAHLQSNIFTSLSTLTSVPDLIPDWRWRDFYNYVLLRPGTAENLETKINGQDYIASQYDLFRQHNIHHDLHLQPITDIHLNSNLSLEAGINGDAQSVNILLLIGIFLLLMAWVNYINLTTAKAITRAKEVGVRKTIGASRKSLIGQFLTQSLILNLIAFAVAILLVEAAQPFFQQLAGKTLSFEWLQNPTLLIAIVCIFILGLIGSSAYPAFVLSGFSPYEALRTQSPVETKGALLRKSLIVFQFALSILLIISTIVVVRQLQFMQQKNMGMDISQSLVVRAPSSIDSLTYGKFKVFKNRLLQMQEVEGVSAAHLVPGDEEIWVPSIRSVQEDPNRSINRIIHLNAIDPQFIPQFQLKMLAGRNFTDEEMERSNAMILTEAACKKWGIDDLESVIGQQYSTMGDTFSVVGVVSDYQQWGLQKAAGDYVFINRPEDFRRYAIKLKVRDLDNTLQAIQNTYESLFPEGVFEHYFLEEHFAQQYAADRRFSKIISLFAGLAIFISCLGLLGLSLFMILQRRKEIGIRKVLGATTVGIVQLLSKDFLKLVLLATIIATPLAWYFLRGWLENFAHRIDLQWWMFVVAGVLTIVIMLSTIGYQSVKAALANPVKSLKSE